MSTSSVTMFGCASFLTPLSDSSKSFFFFPMVMRRRTVAVVGVEVAVVWAMAGTMSTAFQRPSACRTRCH
jgi:hypothetical protein